MMWFLAAIIDPFAVPLYLLCVWAWVSGKWWAWPPLCFLFAFMEAGIGANFRSVVLGRAYSFPQELINRFVALLIVSFIIMAIVAVAARLKKMLPLR